MGRQFALGMVQTTEGLPIVHEVHAGTIGETKALIPMIERTGQRHVLKRGVLVADRGVLSLVNLGCPRGAARSYPPLGPPPRVDGLLPACAEAEGSTARRRTGMFMALHPGLLHVDWVAPEASGALPRMNRLLRDHTWGVRRWQGRQPHLIGQETNSAVDQWRCPARSGHLTLSETSPDSARTPAVHPLTCNEPTALLQTLIRGVAGARFLGA